ncbi:O-antigen polymerase [Croceicoccus sp. F390]|uniref:O-antigen polymerase n=1 Tax=Croceicoccus esteveae TaxID=3075597 RepID=A0ABU2ZH73_9SPHN|nr:O-antigen polymerase [Croceicoccus sp. F390]MDT0575730.1 O-antigen polymerase [Croceicoccus sp. F390]
MYLAAVLLSLLTLTIVATWFVRSRIFSVFHPLTFYLAFHAFVFVLRPLLAVVLDYRTVYRFYGFVPSTDDRVTVIIASNLGMVAFAFFAARAGNVPMRFAAGPAVAKERRQLASILPAVLVICLPLGLFSLWQRLNNAALGFAVEGMQLDRGTGAFINTQAIGYVTDAQLVLASSCALIAWFFRFRLLAWLPLGVFVVLRAGTGGRGPIIVALVLAALFYLYDRQLSRPSARLVTGAAAVLALFSAIGIDRGAAVREAFGMSAAAMPGPTHDDAFLEGMDFANMEYFEFVVYAVPQRSGTYDYFLNNLQILTEPVPRVLWPAKPIGPPVKRVELFDYGYPIGMTFSLPGLGWYQLGYAGVVIWCGLWGWVLGLFYRRFATGPQTVLHTASYMILLAVLLIAFRDGMLLSIIRTLAFYLLPVMLLWLLARGLGMTAAAPPHPDTERTQSGRAARSVTPGTPAQRRRRMARAWLQQRKGGA